MRQDLEIDQDDLALLDMVARLRMVTAEQARFLLPSIKGKSVQAARARLKGLTALGLLQSRTTTNMVTAAHVFKLASRGLRALGRPTERQLLAWPVGWMTPYFHFRNNVFARLVEDGWTVAGRTFSPPESHPAVLEIYKIAAVLGFGGAADRADPMTAGSLRREQETLDLYLPREVTFDIAFKREPRRPAQVILLAIDDPKRRIEGKSLATPGQIDLLPRQGWPGMTVLARDAWSEWNSARQKVNITPRHRAWRRALTSRFGESVQLDDPRFSSYWPAGGYHRLWRLAARTPGSSRGEEEGGTGGGPQGNPQGLPPP